MKSSLVALALLVIATTAPALSWLPVAAEPVQLAILGGALFAVSSALRRSARSHFGRDLS
jgi:hypothetical protein